MNLGTAKNYLNKINRLFSGFEEDSGDVSQIEKDLMLSYVRAFYDSLLFEASSVPSKPQSPKPTVAKTKPLAPKVEPPKPKVTIPKVETPTVPVKPPTPEPKQEKPVIVQKPIPPKPKVEIPKVKIPKTEIPTVERPKVEPPKFESSKFEPPKVEPTQPKTEKPPIAPITPVTPVTPVSFDEYDLLFEEQAVTSTIQKLGQSKISNLRSSMGINERFLIQNELFGGNSSKFNDAIDSFDSFDNFNQAKAYIMKVVAKENDWLHEKKVKRAQSFIRKIKRRYK